MKLDISGKSAQVVAAAKKTVSKAPRVLRDEDGALGGAKGGKGKAPAKPGR